MACPPVKVSHLRRKLHEIAASLPWSPDLLWGRGFRANIHQTTELTTMSILNKIPKTKFYMLINFGLKSQLTPSLRLL